MLRRYKTIVLAAVTVIADRGPKWRVHYYAHLAEPLKSTWLVGAGTKLGSVGTSGNAHIFMCISVLPQG